MHTFYNSCSIDLHWYLHRASTIFYCSGNVDAAGIAMGAVSVPYSLPPPHLAKPIVICGLVMVLSASRHLSAIHAQMLSNSPTAAKCALWVQHGVFWFLYGAHTIESAVFAKKLREHGVSLLSVAWWKWMAECFVGGKFCFQHFDDMVKNKI